MPELEGGSEQVDEGQFDDVEWELCSSAREAGVLLLPFAERAPWSWAAENRRRSGS